MKYIINELNDNDDALAITNEVLIGKLFMVRGHKVMIDSDLSELYGVENKRLKEQVRRNMERFPMDFMFELTEEEYREVKTFTKRTGRGGHTKYLPFALTEHGILMLFTKSAPRLLNGDRLCSGLLPGQHDKQKQEPFFHPFV